MRGFQASAIPTVQSNPFTAGAATSWRPCAASKGGAATLEQPPCTVAWLEPDAMPALKKFRCLAWVDACMYDMPLQKSWAFASTSEDIQHVASLCHHSFKHQSTRKKDVQGGFLSSCPKLSSPHFHSLAGTERLAARQARASQPMSDTQQKPDRSMSDAQEEEALDIIFRTLGLSNRQHLMAAEPGPHTQTGDKDLAL